MRVLADLALTPPPWLTYPESIRLFSELEAAGGQARFVGGCVRDALLGHISDDLDVCTDLSPETVLAVLTEAGLKVIPTGLKHGTVTAFLGGHKYEITTLRVDVKSFGRHAEVAFTDSWRDDAARRDFTINALYLEISGELHDYYDGVSDLAEGMIQFIGDANKRIEEDYLRVLRFFRFFGRYGIGVPDERSLSACQHAAGKLNGLSAERISKEVLQILGSSDPLKVLLQMQNTGILDALFGRKIVLSLLQGMLSLPLDCDPINRLAALLEGDITFAKATSKALRLSARTEKRLVYMCGEFLSPHLTLHEQKVELYKLGLEIFRDRVFLSWASNPENTAYSDYLNFADSWVIPQYPVTGKDLLEKGFQAGAGLGVILRELETEWINSDFNLSREELLKKVTSSNS